MNVLIADDHHLFRDGLRRLLMEFDPEMTIFEAETCAQTLEQCDGGAAFDLILFDLCMPGWSGFQVLDALREAQPDARVIVVSGSDRRADLAAALEHGAAGFIPKASKAAVALGAVRLVLAGGVYLPAQALDGTMGGLADGLAGDAEETGCVDHQLTPRQRDVLLGLRAGKSNKEIANDLGLTESTVKVHVTAILRALGVQNRTQAALTAPTG